MPTFWRSGFKSLLLVSESTTRSPSVTVPDVGFSNAFKCCKIVDFPEPVCPMMAVYFPDGILKFTSNSARVSKGVFAWYAKFTSLKRMSITIPPTLLHQDTLQELLSPFREVLRLISLQTAHRVPFQQASYLI